MTKLEQAQVLILKLREAGCRLKLTSNWVECQGRMPSHLMPDFMRLGDEIRELIEAGK
jgi:hypothetical protein